MNDLTLLERLSALCKVVFSSPFFIVLFAFMILTIITFSVYGATKNKYSKIVLTISYSLTLLFLFFKYGKLLYGLFDTFIDQVFVAIYFPNLITYICMTVIASLLMIITIINKKLKGFIRICNILAFSGIQFLFILVMDSINKSNIDIYNKTALYSNQTLMIIIQASMAIFAVWISLLIINLIINLLDVKIVNNTVLEVKSDFDGEIQYFTEDDFYKGFVSYNRRKKYDEYLNINSDEH